MAYEQGQKGLVKVQEMPEEALAAFEKADTQAILEHLTTGGVGLESFLYSFPMGHGEERREIVGIGWAGAKEIARLVGNLEVLPDVKVEEHEDAYYGVVRVRDLSRNVTILGVARQPKDKVLRTGEVRRDEHAFTVAINKAQRNGILALVDEATKLRLVQEFLSTKKGVVMGRPQPVSQRPEAYHRGPPREGVGKDASPAPVGGSAKVADAPPGGKGSGLGEIDPASIRSFGDLWNACLHLDTPLLKAEALKLLGVAGQEDIAEPYSEVFLKLRGMRKP